ncbi:MAG: hypothetical protein QW803_00980 [Candidatus Methanomethylicia archaeon]
MQNNGDYKYGRFGYIQGKEGSIPWKIYMDILGQIKMENNQIIENYNELKKEQEKFIRIDFLTTEQWPYPEGEPMIWQYNPFQIHIRTSHEYLDPYDPSPSGSGNSYSITILLWLGGWQFITISWAQVIAETFRAT